MKKEIPDAIKEYMSQNGKKSHVIQKLKNQEEYRRKQREKSVKYWEMRKAAK